MTVSFLCLGWVGFGSSRRRCAGLLLQASEYVGGSRAGALAEACGFEPLRDARRVGLGVESFVGGFGRCILALPLAQATQRRFGVSERSRASWRAEPVAGLEPPDRLGCKRDAAPAFELGKTLAGPAHCRFQPGYLARESRARLADGVAVGLHYGDRFGGFGGEFVA